MHIKLILDFAFFFMKLIIFMSQILQNFYLKDFLVAFIIGKLEVDLDFN